MFCSVPSYIYAKDLVISYIFFFFSLMSCLSLFAISYKDIFSNSLHSFSYCLYSPSISLSIASISPFSFSALAIISTACLDFSSNSVTYLCLSSIRFWVDSAIRPVRCSSINDWILAWLITMFYIWCKREFILSILSFNIFRYTYLRKVGSLGNSYSGITYWPISLDEFDSSLYSRIPSSILLIANLSHSLTSNGDGSISPLSNLSSLCLFSSDK